MLHDQIMNIPIAALLFAAFVLCLPTGRAADRVKVYVLAGDENALRQGSIDGLAMSPRKKEEDPEQAAKKPGTLLSVMAEDPRYSFLREAGGKWSAREDVAIYDAHPRSNDTRDPATLLQVPAARDDPRGYGVGAELMFGHVMGETLEGPVLLIRFATKHPIWFRRGSRSLGYDFLSPSGGGGLDLDGGWDVIHFNHGVWDLAAVDPENPQRRLAPDKGGEVRIPPEQYEKNLRLIVARLNETGATLIWAHTTPILPGSGQGYFGGETVDQYNAIAAKVMKENGVIINDLNAESRRQGKPKAPNVHDVGKLAPKVTETIRSSLEARHNPSRPLPRVLFIGDSITGTYWETVKQNLDGKAFVAKNPGNGEHSGTGVRLVDEWVDLQQYLLNGQEYLELIDSVKVALGDFDRYCPQFAGGDPELSGFVWFQGIADAQSPAFAAAYEKNLAGFIRDVRDDLDVPKLPFVVVSLGQYGDSMNPDTRKVHRAQMAVGDPALHPEFRDNVASVDTIPFYLPKAQSPGGREWDYHDNAHSFLRIGEATAKAMLPLIE